MTSVKRASIGHPNGTNAFDKSNSNVSQKPKDHSSTEPVEIAFKPWRVFINHLDSYHGRKLADFLSERDYVDPQGSTEEEIDEEEGEEEEDEKFHMKAVTPRVESSKKFEVIGTTVDPEYRRLEDVTMIIKEPKDREALLAELMKCGIVIYDITLHQDQIDEARWALKAIVRELEKMEQKAPKVFKRNEEVRYFVLISTLMTWAHTRPLNPDEPDLPFTEEDYRKRRAHPNFKQHIQCEKDVVMAKKKQKLKDKLKTVVICSGVTYGDEEDPLHYLFKMAWQNAPFLPIFGPGHNRIPLLHVRDLIAVVSDVLQNWSPIRYIVAAEQELASQSTIVKKISRALTSGKVKNIPEEEAFLLPDVTQQTFDLMTMNLNIDPEYIVDRISWHLDMPFRDSIDAIVKEYKAARNLHPVKIIVLGPPASGKTKIARYLQKHYDIHYVHVKSLIADTVQKLTVQIEDATAPVEQVEGKEAADEPEEDDEDDEETTNVEELQELLDEIERNIHRNNGRLDDALVNKLFLRRLRSGECLNQGYVIDGYPKTLDQAKRLFEEEILNEEEEIDEEIESAGNYSIMPELVVSLEASDEFLKERIINRPEREIQGTHYTEEHMLRRLKEYRKRNTEENTPLQLFDEVEIHPLIVNVENDVCPDMFPTIYQCLERLGLPRNYGLTAAEAEARKRAEEEAHAAETAKRLEQEREILEQKRQREEKMAEWMNLMEKLKEEEEERLCVLGLPLRHYLVKHVFPTLTQGLIEVAKLRPDDPVDYLAEYLFKENPEGKMFEPDYTRTMSSVLNAIEKFQDEVLPAEELDDKVMEYLKQESMQQEQDETSISEADVSMSRRIVPCVTPTFSYDDTGSCERGEDTGSDKTECCYCRHD